MRDPKPFPTYPTIPQRYETTTSEGTWTQFQQKELYPSRCTTSCLQSPHLNIISPSPGTSPGQAQARATPTSPGGVFYSVIMAKISPTYSTYILTFHYYQSSRVKQHDSDDWCYQNKHIGFSSRILPIKADNYDGHHVRPFADTGDLGSTYRNDYGHYFGAHARA